MMAISMEVCRWRAKEALDLVSSGGDTSEQVKLNSPLNQEQTAALFLALDRRD